MPYSYDEVMTALRNADAAGDTEGATRLASIANGLRTPKEAAPPIEPPTNGEIVRGAVDANPLSVQAAGEAGLNMLTGAVAAPIAGLRGVASLVGGGSADDAAEAVRGTQEALTYKPRTQGGQAVTDAVGYIPEKIGEAINWAGEKSADAAQYMGASPEVAGGIGAAVKTAPAAIGAAMSVRGMRRAQDSAGLGIHPDKAPHVARMAASRAGVDWDGLPGTIKEKLTAEAVTGGRDAVMQNAKAIVEQGRMESVAAKAGLEWNALSQGVRQRISELAKNADNLDNVDPLAVQRIARAGGLEKPITMTRGQAMRDPAELRAEGQLAMTAEGRPIAEAHLTQNATLQENLDLLRGKFKGTAPDKAEAGRRMTRAMESARTQANNRVSNLYRRAEEAGEMADPVGLDTAAAHDLAAYLRTHPEPEFTKFVKNKLPEYFDADPETGQLILREGVEGIPVNALETTIRAANAIKLKDFSTKGHYAREIAEKLDAMIPDEAGGLAYREARRARRDMAAKFDDPKTISRLIERDPNAVRQTSLENVFSKTIADKGVSKAELARVRRTLLDEGSRSTRKLGAQAWRDMQAQTVQHIKDAATRSVGTDALGNPSLTPGALKAARESIGDGKLELILGKDGLAQLKAIEQVTADVKTVPAAGPHLGSSTLQNAAAMLDKLMDKLSRAPIGDIGRGAVKMAQGVREKGQAAAQVERAIGKPITLKDIDSMPSP